MDIYIFDDRHLNFIFETIFHQIQTEEMADKGISIVCQDVTPRENWEKLDISYYKERAIVQPLSSKSAFLGTGDFEDLSLGLGLARRIMRKNKGEMSVPQGEGGKVRILLQFQGQAPS